MPPEEKIPEKILLKRNGTVVITLDYDKDNWTQLEKYKESLRDREISLEIQYREKIHVPINNNNLTFQAISLSNRSNRPNMPPFSGNIISDLGLGVIAGKITALGTFRRYTNRGGNNYQARWFAVTVQVTHSQVQHTTSIQNPNEDHIQFVSGIPTDDMVFLEITEQLWNLILMQIPDIERLFSRMRRNLEIQFIGQRNDRFVRNLTGLIINHTIIIPRTTLRPFNQNEMEHINAAMNFNHD